MGPFGFGFKNRHEHYPWRWAGRPLRRGSGVPNLFEFASLFEIHWKQVT